MEIGRDGGRDGGRRKEKVIGQSIADEMRWDEMILDNVRWGQRPSHTIVSSIMSFFCVAFVLLSYRICIMLDIVFALCSHISRFESYYMIGTFIRVHELTGCVRWSITRWATERSADRMNKWIEPSLSDFCSRHKQVKNHRYVRSCADISRSAHTYGAVRN